MKRRAQKLEESGWYDVFRVFLQLSLLSPALSIRHLYCSVDSSGILDERASTGPETQHAHKRTVGKGGARLSAESGTDPELLPPPNKLPETHTVSHIQQREGHTRVAPFPAAFFRLWDICLLTMR